MKIPPFLLERYFAGHEFNVRCLLCASDCQSVSIGELLALEPGAEERFFQQRLGYTESAGSPALRQAIAGLYTAIGPEQVLVHSGAEEAIFLFMHAALAARRPPRGAVPLLPVAGRSGAQHRLRRGPLAPARGGRLGPGPGRAAAPDRPPDPGGGGQHPPQPHRLS